MHYPWSSLSVLFLLYAPQPEAESKSAWMEQLLEGERGGYIPARWLRITDTRNKPQSFYYISVLPLMALHKSSLRVKTKLRVRSAFHTSQKRKLRLRRPSGFSKSVLFSLDSLWVQRGLFPLGHSYPFIHSTFNQWLSVAETVILTQYLIFSFYVSPCTVRCSHDLKPLVMTNET